MSEAARDELAPNGRLRAALNYSNFLLVSARAPEHAGVAPDLARELARRANATVEFVGYENAGLVADAAKDNAWDVAFIGAEPARASEIAFTPAYVEIEATYLVPAASPIRTHRGRRSRGRAHRHRGAGGLHVVPAAHAAARDARRGRRRFRDRSISSRVASRRAGGPEAAAAGGRAEVAGRAAARGTLHRRAAIDGRPAPTRRGGGLSDRVCREIKSSGLLRTLIERHDARGLSIAAPPRR